MLSEDGAFSASFFTALWAAAGKNIPAFVRRNTTGETSRLEYVKRPKRGSSASFSNRIPSSSEGISPTLLGGGGLGLETGNRLAEFPSVVANPYLRCSVSSDRPPRPRAR